MRLLHVLPPAAGGMLRHVQRLLSGLDPARYEQYCAAAPGVGLEPIAADAPGRALPLPLRDGAGPAALLRAALVLARQARALRPHLLHAHGYRAMLLAAVAGRLSRTPFLFTAHSLPDELGARFWRLAGPLAAGARAGVCVSHAVRAELAPHLKQGAAGGPPLPVIYNGIDPGPAPGARGSLPDDLGGAARRPVLVTAARLAPQKGIAVLLEAWASLATILPEGLLIVAGDGPLRPHLEARAADLGIAGSVCFAGFRGDVRRLLRAADVAVVPSLREGQSLFVLEAMAEGAPVVASQVGGLPEMVRHEETGLLVPPADAAALAAALHRLTTEAPLARRLAAEARAFVTARMTTEQMLARLDALYQEVGG